MIAFGPFSALARFAVRAVLVTVSVTAPLYLAGCAAQDASSLMKGAPTAIRYAENPANYTVGEEITPNTITSAGGPATRYSIEPALPEGLAFDELTGVISGKPTVITPAATYAVTVENGYGSNFVKLVLAVNDIPPAMTYADMDPKIFNVGVPIDPITPTLSEGATLSCVSVPELPAGLTLSSSCEISGTPLEGSDSTTYLVSAVNSGGAATLVFDFTVIDIPPVVAFTGSPFDLVRGKPMTPLLAESTGGKITSCTTTPDLPAGLTLAADCKISGTPTDIVPDAPYVIKAINNGGDASVTIHIAVDDEPVSISYSADPYKFTKGQAITPLLPSSTGGIITGCAIDPALPSGLSLSATTCEVTGTPDTPTAEDTYTVTASNTKGDGTAEVKITVVDRPPVIRYVGSAFSYRNGSVIVPAAAINTGGAIVACTASPALPPGLSLGATDCLITGKPLASSPKTNYEIKADNSGGSGKVTISIVVAEAAPVLSYGAIPVLRKSVGMVPVAPVNTGGTATSCTSTPALPPGLSLSSACVISGTPGVVTPLAEYTISGSNTAGTSIVKINLEVKDAAPAISYPASPYTFAKGSVISTISVSNMGGPITSCSINPLLLPTGLSFSATTCAISGTPSAVASAADYTVEAQNDGGSSSTTINLAVNDTAPALSYAGSPFSFTVGMAVAPASPINTGGAIVSCAVSPPLPASLVLNAADCQISGTPDALAAATPYTVTATNSGGSGSVIISIAVVDVPPSIDFSGNETQSYTKGVAIAPLSPTNAPGAGVITACASTPALPPGLVLSSTCQLTGAPSAVRAAADYVIRATNTGGASQATLNITVQDAAITISYPDSPHTFTKNDVVSITPTVTGGAVTSCAVSPALPAGLNLSNACVITGTASALSPAADYTITATNSSGTATAVVNIFVKDALPELSFADPAPYDKGVAIAALSPVNTGGAITSCAVDTPLPAGLSLSATCVITGTPCQARSDAAYVITATNSGGTDSATVHLSVRDSAPVFSFTPDTRIFREREDIGAIAPSSTGGAIIDCDPVPALPSGILLSDACELSGTPDTPTGAQLYTLTATALGGLTATTTITLSVRAQPLLLFHSRTALDGSMDGPAAGSYNIWKAAADGVRVALTGNAGAGSDSLFPIFRPDGAAIAYGSQMAPAAALDVWTDSPAGGSPVRLGNGAAGADLADAPAFSPNGAKLALAARSLVDGTATASSNLLVMNAADGSALTAVTANVGAGYDSRSPVFSPNGATIFYASKTDLAGGNDGAAAPFNIWKVALADLAAPAPLTGETVAGIDCIEPRISPDGTTVLYSAKSSIGLPSGSFNVWKMKADGTLKTPLTANTAPNLDSYHASFSPDGAKIVFVSRMDVNGAAANSFNVWVMNADGTGAQPLTRINVPGQDSAWPQFSPDGTRIAFLSKKNIGGFTPAVHNLWVMKADGTGAAAITSNTAAGLDTTISPHSIWFQP